MKSSQARIRLGSVVARHSKSGKIGVDSHEEDVCPAVNNSYTLCVFLRQVDILAYTATRIPP